MSLADRCKLHEQIVDKGSQRCRCAAEADIRYPALFACLSRGITIKIKSKVVEAWDAATTPDVHRQELSHVSILIHEASVETAALACELWCFPVICGVASRAKLRRVRGSRGVLLALWLRPLVQFVSIIKSNMKDSSSEEGKMMVQIQARMVATVTLGNAKSRVNMRR